MNTALYLIGQLIIILLCVGVVRILIFGLRNALVQLKIPNQKRQQLINYVRWGCIFWLAILGILAYNGFFIPFDTIAPRFLLVLIPPLSLILYLLCFSRMTRLLLKVIPEKWLIRVQGIRILTELFFGLGFLGLYIPPQMTFLWLNQDVIVGATAPLAAWLFFSRGRYQKPEAIMWNVFGIALLINIIIITSFSLPSSYRVFFNEPSNIFITQFPFIWIIGFIYPFALAMHLFSLRQLIMNKTRPISRQFLQNRRRFFK